MYCEPCIFRCASCEHTVINCTKCAGVRVNLPSCQCPDGYYEEPGKTECEKCND